VAREHNIFMPALVLAAVLGAAFAVFMLWLGFRDNNQGEFFDPQMGATAWRQTTALFFGWFIPIFLPITLIGVALQWLHHKARKVRS
jgi:hypothetical protein